MFKFLKQDASSTHYPVSIIQLYNLAKLPPLHNLFWQVPHMDFHPFKTKENSHSPQKCFSKSKRLPGGGHQLVRLGKPFPQVSHLPPPQEEQLLRLLPLHQGVSQSM